jgi:hypothetical protein
MVSSWDVPDDDFANVENAQAKLKAGISADEP